MDMSTPPVVTKRELKKYIGAAARLLTMIINGAKQEEAAAAVGVSPGYVAQLCAEEDFQIHIVEGTRTIVEKAVQIDNDLLYIESEMIKRLKTLSLSATTTSEVLRVLKYTNEAKRKTNTLVPQTPGTGLTGEGGATAQAVTIVIPQFIQQQFIMTPNKEIIGIGERELVTMDSKQLNQMAINSKPEPPKLELQKDIPRETVKRVVNADPWSEL